MRLRRRLRLKPIQRQWIVVCLVLLMAFGLTTCGATAEPVSQHKEDTGIIGGLMHFVGEVVAFPFRVIGSSIDAIF